MPIHRYICDSCGHTFDLYQSFKERPKKKCPECWMYKLYKDYSGVYGCVVKEPSSVKHLADRNTKKSGKYEYEAKLQKTKPKKPPREIPFWRDGPVRPELLTATDAEKRKYVDKGVMPPNRIQELKDKIKEKKRERKKQS